jgi:hypothetical protein
MTIIRTLTLATLLTPSLMAQTPPASPAPQVPSTEPDPAILRAMKSKVFVIQHRDPFRLEMSLGPLGSGTKGARMNSSRDEGFNTISVRDFPENLAAIEEAIKRLDVPSATQSAPDVELTLHVLFATKAAVAEAGLPPDLQEVVKQLKSTLAYRGYTLAASFVQRAQIQSDRRIEGSGLIDPKAYGSEEVKEVPRMIVNWSGIGVGIDAQKGRPALIRLRDFGLSLQERRSGGDERLASFRTDLNFKEGEKVVVGTSTIKDRGLIVVLTAHCLN